MRVGSLELVNWISVFISWVEGQSAVLALSVFDDWELLSHFHDVRNRLEKFNQSRFRGISCGRHIKIEHTFYPLFPGYLLLTNSLFLLLAAIVDIVFNSIYSLCWDASVKVCHWTYDSTFVKSPESRLTVVIFILIIRSIFLSVSCFYHCSTIPKMCSSHFIHRQGSCLIRANAGRRTKGLHSI